MAYRVVGGSVRGFAVIAATGAIEYDLLERRVDANDICEILNRGIGPEWDAVEAELDRIEGTGR